MAQPQKSTEELYGAELQGPAASLQERTTTHHRKAAEQSGSCLRISSVRKRVTSKSPVRSCRTPGSVRGRSGNWPSYRDGPARRERVGRRGAVGCRRAFSVRGRGILTSSAPCMPLAHAQASWERAACGRERRQVAPQGTGGVVCPSATGAPASEARTAGAPLALPKDGG